VGKSNISVIIFSLIPPLLIRRLPKKTFAQIDLCPDGHFPTRHLPRWTFAHKTFAKKDICPERQLSRRSLPKATFVQKNISAKIHLPRRHSRTFARQYIYPDRHLATRAFVLEAWVFYIVVCHIMYKHEWCSYYASVCQIGSNWYEPRTARFKQNKMGVKLPSCERHKRDIILRPPLPVECGKAPSGIPDLQTNGEREEGEGKRERKREI
jgi:hypothetical protein